MLRFPYSHSINDLRMVFVFIEALFLILFPFYSFYVVLVLTKALFFLCCCCCTSYNFKWSSS